MRKRTKYILGTIALLVVASASVLAWSMEWLVTLGGDASGSEFERILASPNYDAEAGIFINPIPTSTMSGKDSLATAREWLDKPHDSVPPGPLPIVAPDFAPPADGVRLTWLGHSTYVMQFSDATVLTDPVFGERASPSKIMGPKRFHAVPITVDELPKLDAIVISHDHYDHLDYYAVEALLESSDAPFLVPLGVGAHLQAWDVPDDRIIVHDWWDATELGSLKLVATPSRHFSGRKGYDQYTTLWASWTILHGDDRVFFSGDTGYFPGLREIARKYGPFDVALFEIGAYHDNWGQIHLGPGKALAAHELIGADLVIPIHWGTFDLGLHRWWEPPTQFADAADAAGVRWSIPAIGGAIEPGRLEPRERWWQ